MFGLKVFQYFEIIFFVSLAYLGIFYASLTLLAYLIYRFLTSRPFAIARATCKRDLSGLFLLIRLKWDINMRLHANQPLNDIFLTTVRKYRDKEALVEIETGRVFTFEQLNNLCNQYAHFFQAEGYEKGDVVSLFLENRADFPAIWLGLSKLGVITAWINTNLRAEPLAHSISVSRSKSVITSKTLLPALEDVFRSEKLEKSKVYVVDDDGPINCSIPVATKVSRCSSEEPVVRQRPDFRSTLCYIFTSGTTGNPKPALIKHYRYYLMATGVAKSFGVIPTDRMYVMMPIYHSAGGVCGIGQMVIQGCTAVLRKKFSASSFWKDCLKYECTVSQYIGEICRYLLAQKEVAEEKKHKVRIMFGNGLRPTIWREFVNRFCIERIGELYGSTEGNSSIVNLDNHVGACGFIPVHPFVKYLYPVQLLKMDDNTGEILRGPDGFCVLCKPGESGHMVGTIMRNQPLLSFEGYVNEKDTGKKVIRNVRRKGDAAFTTGDIMYWDEFGYLYFKDRIGDTYRWKGENVSTTEVEGVMHSISKIVNVVVYGVKIPKREGRAGMAAVLLADGVLHEDALKEISAHLWKTLPVYAIPIFIRFCKNFDQTGTYKLKKTSLMKAAFDLKSCHGEQIYVWEPSSKSYKKMDNSIQQQIEEGCYRDI